jgi:nucleoside phosphorylase
MAIQFVNLGIQHDLLYDAEYDHSEKTATCSQYDVSRLINRKARLSENPVVHYGLIASGDQIMRYGVTRDRLKRELDVLCFEIKAAELMDRFPYFVIRGICDYADLYKNKS